MLLLSSLRGKQRLGSKTENVNLQEADRMGFELLVSINIMHRECYFGAGSSCGHCPIKGNAKCISLALYCTL
jgi:hypothetical protein